jgi:hypothetical protein
LFGPAFGYQPTEADYVAAANGKQLLIVPLGGDE